MKICVIILNFNGLKDTLECLDSLKKVQHDNFSILVADNGSKDGSLNVIKTHYPEVLLLDNLENLGYAEGNNRAIKHCLDHFEALLILNNDTVVAPTILTAFEKQIETNPASVLGAKIYQHKNQNIFDHLGGFWNSARVDFDLFGSHLPDDGISFEEPIELDYVCGCALFAKVEIFKKIGFFDARFFLFWEESDFCFRAKRAGYKIRLCPQAKLWHKVSASFTGGKPHTTYYWWRNRLLWLEKNVSRKEFFQILFLTIFPQTFKLLRHFLIKKFTALFSCSNQKRQYIQTNKAALCGIRDYFLRRFYLGPNWIFEKKKSKNFS